MGEIKFRAWDDTNKILAPVVEMLFDQYGGMDVRPAQRMGINSNPLGRSSLMQSTGLTDKEIYEGGIVRYTNKYSGKEFVAETKWFEEQACFAAYKNGVSSVYDCDSDWLAFNDLEVVGNIYENPELITSPFPGLSVREK